MELNKNSIMLILHECDSTYSCLTNTYIVTTNFHIFHYCNQDKTKCNEQFKDQFLMNTLREIPKFHLIS